MRAAKIFIDATSLEANNAVQNQQNNFIQINGTVITEQDLKELPEDLLSQLHEILRKKVSRIKN